MKAKLLLFMLFPFVFVVEIMSQESKNKCFGVEAGIDFVGCDLTNQDNIRSETPSYYYYSGQSTKNLSILCYKNYFGIKREVFFLSNRLGLTAGLRYTRMHGSVGKDTYWGSVSDFFYFMYQQTGTTTEYLKIKGINQNSDYIGIPLEFRWLCKEWELGRYYYKTGAEFDIRVHTKTTVDFSDNAMKTFESSIVKMLGNPHTFTSLLYFAIGFKLGDSSKPSANLEFGLPIYLINETSGLVRPYAGGGFQFSVQLPIKSKSNEK